MLLALYTDERWQIPSQFHFGICALSKAFSCKGFHHGSVAKNPAAKQETLVQSLGQEDPLEKGNGNPLQYSSLKDPSR